MQFGIKLRLLEGEHPDAGPQAELDRRVDRGLNPEVNQIQALSAVADKKSIRIMLRRPRAGRPQLCSNGVSFGPRRLPAGIVVTRDSLSRETEGVDMRLVATLTRLAAGFSHLVNTCHGVRAVQVSRAS